MEGGWLAGSPRNPIVMGDWGWHWGMGFGSVLAILFWALILLGIVALARVLLTGGGWPGSAKGPLDILNERYARGEITREQYEQMRRDIEA
jgi:putative membrane protein